MARSETYAQRRTVPFEVRRSDGGFRFFGSGEPKFTIWLKGNQDLNAFGEMTLLEAAEAFIDGLIDVQGDLPAAVMWKHEQTHAQWWQTDLPRFALALRNRSHRREDIDFHYSKAPEFYRQFLDSSLVYSCGYFADENWSLERAQVEKLDLVCRKLCLQPGERFLDLGCGWGALVIYAAQHYNVQAQGCTVSAKQQQYAQDEINRQKLSNAVGVTLTDYSDTKGSFLKIASIGMCEHVGRSCLGSYFHHVYRMLMDGGLFLNQSVVRPRTVMPDAESQFLRRNIFPGGDLPSLSELIEYAELAGFEVFDVENLRPHYALTCRAWLDRLTAHKDTAVDMVGERTYRTWLLYLAASAATFEAGITDVVQMTMTKRFAPASRAMSREALYTNTGKAEAHWEGSLKALEIGASWL